jgi:hypothetical protein
MKKILIIIVVSTLNALIGFAQQPKTALWCIQKSEKEQLYIHINYHVHLNEDYVYDEDVYDFISGIYYDFYHKYPLFEDWVNNKKRICEEIKIAVKEKKDQDIVLKYYDCVIEVISINYEHRKL